MICWMWSVKKCKPQGQNKKILRIFIYKNLRKIIKVRLSHGDALAERLLRLWAQNKFATTYTVYRLIPFPTVSSFYHEMQINAAVVEVQIETYSVYALIEGIHWNTCKMHNMHRFRNDFYVCLLNFDRNNLTAGTCWSEKLHSRI